MSISPTPHQRPLREFRPSTPRRPEGPLPPFGLLEWIHFGDHDAVERLIQDVRDLGVAYLRTGFSWADYHRPDGPAWYDWLLERLSREAEVLPCFVYTPPSIGRKPNTASQPRDLGSFAALLDEALDRYGRFFAYVELWNEGNNHHYWDWYEDPEWVAFAEMIGKAAVVVRQRGWKTVLGGMSPTDPPWLWLMGQHGVLDYIDIVGVHGFPDTWDDHWLDWGDTLATVRQTLAEGGWARPLWITEAGYSTWRHDEHRQALEFVRAIESDADRVYWYSAHDLHPDRASDSGFHRDDRHYHFGLRTADDRPKLLWRLLAHRDAEKLRQVARHAERVPAVPRPPAPQAQLSGDGAPPAESALEASSNGRAKGRGHRKVVLLGGAGFVGTNLAAKLLAEGQAVRVVDNLHRPGAMANLRWLSANYGSLLEVELGDVRNMFALRHAVRDAAAVFHFAAQVAVTTSLHLPRHDFEVNLQGTLNVLEAVRELPTPPPLLFTSSNKVYGELRHIRLRELAQRYEPEDATLAATGIGERQPLDFRSPYGCSKGAADQYVLDYSRSYGLPATVFRMSCTYGPHQFGNEDQGWVAHFLIRALQQEPVTIYGDGRQVRDVLFVGDLVEAMIEAIGQIDRTAGRAFNVGGGAENNTSLLELIDRIRELTGRPPAIEFGPRRQGDQRYYVSDTAALRAAVGWRPRVSLDEGLRRLHEWLCANHPSIPEESTS